MVAKKKTDQSRHVNEILKQADALKDRFFKEKGAWVVEEQRFHF